MFSDAKEYGVIVCWTAKGGSGCSVVAGLLARALADEQPTTLVDIGGDQLPMVGLETTATLGIHHWLRSGSDVLPEALSQIAITVDATLRLIGPGSGLLPPDNEHHQEQAKKLHSALPNAIVDAGLVRHSRDLSGSLAAQATTSLLIIRPCYLAIRKANSLSLRPSGIIVVDEPGRALTARDISEVLGAPVLATIAVDPSVARNVDAGRLLKHRHRSTKALTQVAKTLITEEQVARSHAA